MDRGKGQRKDVSGGKTAMRGRGSQSECKSRCKRWCGRQSVGSEYSAGLESASALVFLSPDMCETSRQHRWTAARRVSRSKNKANGKLVVKQAFRAASAPVLSEAEGRQMGTEHNGRRDEAAIISPPCARAS